jgi:periplasmic protein TonB
MRRSKPENASQGSEKSDFVLSSCLVDGDISSVASARRTRREAFGISLAIEILILGFLVAAPLFSSVAQPYLRPTLPMVTTFFRSGPRPKLGEHVTAVATSHAITIYDPYPPITPVHPVGSIQSDEPPSLSAPDPGGDGIYIPGGESISGGRSLEILREPPAVSQPVQQEKRPVKISEGLLQAQLISRIEPRYPALALQTKTEGVVRLHAIISRDGRITSLDILSGHPLLVKAALEAVSQWRYRPTMLNGVPVEVETSITMIFQLHN